VNDVEGHSRSLKFLLFDNRTLVLQSIRLHESIILAILCHSTEAQSTTEANW